MKKFTILLLLFALASDLQAQLMQASIGQGTASNRLKIFIKPNVSQTQASISTLQFNIAIPSTTIPKPTLSVVGNSSSTFMGITWQVDQITEGGYHNYYITTALSPIVFNTVAGTEYEIMEVQFTGGVATTTASLLSLVDGGSNFNLLFLCTGTIQSNGANLYYSRPGVMVNNQNTYDLNGLVSGVAPSTASLGGVTLPIKFLNFSAVRKSNDALISWTVDNDTETEKYIIERSTDGTSFSTIGEMSKRSGSGTKQYEFTDPAITSLGGRVVYYQVKSTEAGNRFTYTETKISGSTWKGSSALYPNPAKDGFTLTIPYLNPGQQRVQLHLVNALGQVVDQRNITRLAAANYYYGFQSALVLSGDYLLKIYEDGQLMETKRVVVKKIIYLTNTLDGGWFAGYVRTQIIP